MKIVYLHQYFTTPRMKGGTRSYEFARRLVKAGHSVCVLTSGAASEDACKSSWHVTSEEGVEVHWYRCDYDNRFGVIRRIAAFLSFAVAACFRLRMIKGDVVFATSTPLTIAIPGLFYRFVRGIPMVFEVRDLWPEVPIAMGALRNPVAVFAARCLEKMAYVCSHHVVALSPQMVDGVIKCGVPRHNVTLIPNACDLEMFQVDAQRGVEFRAQRDWLGNRPLVVYTGTLGPANASDYFVRLAAEALRRDPEIRFLMIGSGKCEDAVRQLANESGVLNVNFFMEKSIHKCEIPNVLSAATIATSLFANIPELQANSPNKFFDALAAGRPVAVNNGGWLGKLVEQEGIGLNLSPTNLEGAADQLVAALNCSKWVAESSARALRVAKTSFDREKLFQTFENVLLDATATPPKAIMSKAA